ncbi:MAG: hypothetical protein QOF30_88 [Acidimicrobiaceae bacterium]|nr:hypothetical protein [Acidimicrobiaceae bacterium]
MTEGGGTPEAQAGAEGAVGAVGHPRTGRVAGVVQPPMAVLFGDRYRAGRLRLDGTSPVARWFVRLGIVFLVGVNLSLLYASRGGWRREPLVSVLPGNHPLFAPQSLLPFTLVALVVGWALVLWGAALSSIVVRLTVAAVFLLVNSDLGGKLIVPHGPALGLRFGPSVVRTGYLAVPVLLVVASIAGMFPRWWRPMRPLLLAGVVTAAVAMFGGLLWVNYAAQRNGGINIVPAGVGTSISTTRSLIIPVLIGAAVEVLELGYSAVTATTMPLRQLSASAVKVILIGLIAVKLEIELVAHYSEVVAFVRHRQLTALCSLLAIAFFAGAGLLLRRPRGAGTGTGTGTGGDDEAEDEDDEGLIYAGAIVLALPLIAIMMLLSLGSLIFEQFNRVVSFLTLDLPVDGIQRNGDIFMAALLFLAGLYLLRRGRRPAVAAAVVIIGAWDLVLAVPRRSGLTLNVDGVLIDILVTLVVAVVLIVRWRRLTAPAASALVALVAFSWIVGARGAYLSRILGGFLPAAAIVTVVTGTLWALLTDSAFAAGSSRLFPDVGRPLLWIGLLVTVATMTNWVAVTHDFDLTQPIASGGFLRLGLPLAAWWVLHRRFQVSPPSAETLTTAPPGPSYSPGRPGPTGPSEA